MSKEINARVSINGDSIYIYLNKHTGRDVFTKTAWIGNIDFHSDGEIFGVELIGIPEELHLAEDNE